MNESYLALGSHNCELKYFYVGLFGFAVNPFLCSTLVRLLNMSKLDMDKSIKTDKMC